MDSHCPRASRTLEMRRTHAKNKTRPVWHTAVLLHVAVCACVVVLLNTTRGMGRNTNLINMRALCVCCVGLFVWFQQIHFPLWKAYGCVGHIRKFAFILTTYHLQRLQRSLTFARIEFELLNNDYSLSKLLLRGAKIALSLLMLRTREWK